MEIVDQLSYIRTPHKLTWEVSMKRFIIEQSDKEFYTSHSGLALVGLCLNRMSSLPAKAKQNFPVRGSSAIGTDDILRSYVGLLTLGQSDCEAITSRKNDDYFKESLGIGKVPSTETLRQRLDEAAPDLRPIADACSVEFLKNAKVTITALDTGHIPLDCDVFPWTTPRPKRKGCLASTMVRMAMPR